MSSTVRIDDDDKRRLKRLQDAWQAARGERPSQHELLGRMLRYLESHTDEFLAEAAWRPWQPEEIERLLAQATDLGDWSVADLDDIVYGDDA